MKKQRWQESAKRTEEARSSEKRKSQKKMQVREKVGKSRNTAFFKWFVAPEDRKVGSLKRRVRSHLARWEMQHGTPLWREAHLKVKKVKTPHVPSTFGSCNVERVHAVVARSTCWSQNVQNTSCSKHVGKLRCGKSARCCGVKHISKSKCTGHHMIGPLLDIEASFCVAGTSDSALCRRCAKRESFVAFPETMAGGGHFKRICKDAFRVAGTVQETCSSEMLGGQGADFLRGVAFWQGDFAWQVQHFVWAGITFRGRRSTLDRWSGKLFLIVSTWQLRKSRRIPSFFWRCKVQTLRKSRRIAAFWFCQVQYWGSLPE